MSSESIIITGGGRGKRMGATIPKQFLLLKGKPILMHTIQCFYQYNPSIAIIVVLPEDQIEFWKNLCKEHDFKIKHQLVKGGSERFHSVKNGLSKVSTEWVGVHDAVRPFVSKNVIANTFLKAKENGAAIPVVSLKESIRKLDKEKSKAIDRSTFMLVQTPQCFSSIVLKKSYETEFKNTYTDDASVVEANNVTVLLVEGNDENIKITTPMDLKIASVLVD